MRTQKDDGSIFILTVCIFMLISIIAINFATTTMNDTVRVKKNINQTHANLVSLSGIEIVKGYILEYQDDFESKVADTSDSYEFPTTINLLNGETEIDLTFWDSDDNELTLSEVSDGVNLDYSVMDRIEVSSKSLYKGQSSQLNGIIKTFDVNSNTAIFDYFHAFVPGAGSNQNDYLDHPILENVSQPVIPTITSYESDINIKNNNTATKKLDPSEVYYYNDITVKGVLNLKMTGNEDEFHKIIVGSTDFRGDVNITGNGILTFYVEDSFNVNKVTFINDPESLLIILQENATFNFNGGEGGNRTFNGFVYGPFLGTSIEFSGNNNVSGGFISNQYKDSSGTYNYAPHPNLDLLETIGVNITPDYKLQFKGFK